MTFRFVFVLLLSLSLSVGTAGCVKFQRSPGSSFYILHSLADGDVDSASIRSGVALGILKIWMPEMLLRPQIVTESSPNQVKVSEVHRWAESLEDGVPRAVAENLAILLPSNRVFTQPFPSAVDLDYKLSIQISRFQRRSNGNVLLGGTWAVLAKGNDVAIDRRTILIEKPVNAQTDLPEDQYRAIAAAMGEALIDLCREIAGEVNGL